MFHRRVHAWPGVPSWARWCDVLWCVLLSKNMKNMHKHSLSLSCITSKVQNNAHTCKLPFPFRSSVESRWTPTPFLLLPTSLVSNQWVPSVVEVRGFPRNWFTPVFPWKHITSCLYHIHSIWILKELSSSPSSFESLLPFFFFLDTLDYLLLVEDLRNQ